MKNCKLSRAEALVPSSQTEQSSAGYNIAQNSDKNKGLRNKYESIENLVEQSGKNLFLVVENVRSAYNVGAMFRTADGTGIVGIILVGYSPTPENPKVMKTALGAETSVPWVTVPNSELILAYAKEKNICQYGLELTPKAQDLFTAHCESTPLFLYVGNEVEGLSQKLMVELDHFLQIPMQGTKDSLNVAEATSIALYEFYRKLRVA